MLFVSKKETHKLETLPDTSLHNDRNEAFANRSCSLSGNPTFFCPSQACIPKLTKDQFDMHREFIRLGSLLMAENADLFHQALTLLSSKHNLQISTPAISISDIIPSTHISRSTQVGESGVIAPKEGSLVAPRASFRKYVLPEDVAAKEFYQCMSCKERHATNSFGTAHVQKCSKPSVRWYCPLCDSFFAVTHRGYHIKSRHSDVVTIVQPQVSSDEEKKPALHRVELPETLKRSRDMASNEEECESATLSPALKVRLTVDGCPSTDSSVLTTASCCSCEETPENPEKEFSFSSSMPFTPSAFSQESSSDVSVPLFTEIEDDHQQSLFSSRSDEDFFVGIPTSSFSY